MSLTVLQPEGETFPFATFTDTEVLIGFQINEGTVVIYQHYLNNLALHMTKTIPEAASILAPISPDATYRVEFQGLDLELYPENLSEYFSCKDMGNGHIQFFSRAHATSTSDWSLSLTNVIMTSSLVWPPSTQEARLDADTLVIQAPASLITKDQPASRKRSHWTRRYGGQTIGLLTYTGDFACRTPEIILVDTGGVHTEEGRGRRSEASTKAAIFSARVPHPLLGRMDHILSVDIDDARGRMVVATRDGSLVIMEFV